MLKMYEKSLQMIKKLDKMPSQSEWNRIAKEKCLMSYISLQYYENKSFIDIWKRVKGVE